MTPNRSRIRWIIADPDTGAVIAPEFAIAIDLDRLTAEQIDAATDASELDLIPADVLDESVSLAALLADGLRWRAWMATQYTETTPAHCSNCGNEWGDIAPMDDEPSALLYCADCRNEYEAAEVTPEPAPNPAHVCDTCGTETPAIWWHYHATGDGTPDEGRKYCGPCWDNLPADKVDE